MEVATIVIRDASNKLTRRGIGERLCMILCSFVCSDRQCDQLQVVQVKCWRSMETRRCASWRLRSFPLHAEWAEELLGPLLLVSKLALICAPALVVSIVHSSARPAKEPAWRCRQSTDCAC